MRWTCPILSLIETGTTSKLPMRSRRRGRVHMLAPIRIDDILLADFSSPLFTRIQRGGWCGLHCAHRATTASSWGLCEHRDHTSCLATLLPSLLASPSWNGTRVGPTAAVERAHSDRARSGSKGSARVSFHPLHRARSASKKGTWPVPPHPSEAARCASTEDHQAPSLPCSASKRTTRLLVGPLRPSRDG